MKWLNNLNHWRSMLAVTFSTLKIYLKTSQSLKRSQKDHASIKGKVFSSIRIESADIIFFLSTPHAYFTFSVENKRFWLPNSWMFSYNQTPILDTLKITMRRRSLRSKEVWRSLRSKWSLLCGIMCFQLIICLQDTYLDIYPV